MTRMTTGERFPLHVRDAERSARQVEALLQERFGVLEALLAERPLRPVELMAALHPVRDTLTGVRAPIPPLGYAAAYGPARNGRPEQASSLS